MKIITFKDIDDLFFFLLNNFISIDFNFILKLFSFDLYNLYNESLKFVISFCFK